MAIGLSWRELIHWHSLASEEGGDPLRLPFSANTMVGFDEYSGTAPWRPNG
jgi:hypothetical protein